MWIKVNICEKLSKGRKFWSKIVETFWGGTEELNSTGWKSQERSKIIRTTTVLGRVALLFKGTWLNMKKQSDNIKPGWHLLGYWPEGYILSGLVENINTFIF